MFISKLTSLNASYILLSKGNLQRMETSRSFGPPEITTQVAFTDSKKYKCHDY